MRIIGIILVSLLFIDLSALAETDVLRNYLWVPCLNSNNVYKVNVLTHEVAAIIPVGGGPAGIAVGPSNVYITCEYSSRLYCISKSLDVVVDSFDLAHGWPFAIGVALDSREQIYVVGRIDSGNYCQDFSLLLKLGPDGTILDSLALDEIQGMWSDEGNMSVIGIAIRDPEIMIPWMCSWDCRTGIIITDTSIAECNNHAINPFSYGYRGPGAAYDESDRGWSSGERAGQNYLINHWQQHNWQYHNIGNWYLDPSIYGDVAVDNSGYVWTGNALGYLIRYDPVQDLSRSFPVSAYNQIRGIAIDRFGYIWAAVSSLHRLYKFDSSGSMVGEPVNVGSCPMGYGDMTGHEFGRIMTSTFDEPSLPMATSLLTAYPNPFNSSTTISFSLASQGPVAISIFDMLGRKVAAPYAGDLGAGGHQVVWDARGFSSGLYFAIMESGDQLGDLRIILIK